MEPDWRTLALVVSTKLDRLSVFSITSFSMIPASPSAKGLDVLRLRKELQMTRLLVESHDAVAMVPPETHLLRASLTASYLARSQLLLQVTLLVLLPAFCLRDWAKLRADIRLKLNWWTTAQSVTTEEHTDSWIAKVRSPVTASLV